MLTQPSLSVILDDIHAAAFRNGLGNELYSPFVSSVRCLCPPPPGQAARFPSANPFLCLLSSLQLSVEDLRAYAASTIVGPRTAVVGTGIDHETLVKLASSTLGALPSANKAAAAPSKYFGGAEVSGCWRGRRLAWAATNLASRFLTLDFSPFPIPDSPQHGWPEQDARGPGL